MIELGLRKKTSFDSRSSVPLAPQQVQRLVSNTLARLIVGPYLLRDDQSLVPDWLPRVT